MYGEWDIFYARSNGLFLIFVHIKINNQKQAAQMVGIYKRMKAEKHFEIIIHYKDVYGKSFIANAPLPPDDSL